MTSRSLILLTLLAHHFFDNYKATGHTLEPTRFNARENEVWKLFCEKLFQQIDTKFYSGINEAMVEKCRDLMMMMMMTTNEGSLGDKKIFNQPQEQQQRQTFRYKMKNKGSIQQKQSYGSNKENFIQTKSASKRNDPQEYSLKKTKIQKNRKRNDSEIHYIRLPPVPYSYVHGLGYISQPPIFSPLILPQFQQNNQKPSSYYLPSKSDVYKHPLCEQDHHHHEVQNNRVPVIRVPIDYVSNAKPTGIYEWGTQSKQEKKPSIILEPPPASSASHNPNVDKQKQDSPIIKLNRGPYFFNGKPQKIFSSKQQEKLSIVNTMKTD